MVKENYKVKAVGKLEGPIYFHPSYRGDMPSFWSSEEDSSVQGAIVIRKPEWIKLDEGDQISIDTSGHNALLFCIEGSFHVSDINRSYATLSCGYMVMLPFGSMLALTALRPSVIVELHFTPSIALCQGICPSHVKQSQIKKAASKDLPASGHSNNAYRIQPPSFLSINESVRVWLDSVVIYLSKLSAESDVFDIKLRELFFLYRLTYQSEDMDMFLRHFHCHNTGFRSFIFNHHLLCRTAEDLADLMGISATSLKRSFQEEFGASPLRWMNERKAQFIRRDLIETDLSMQEMAERYNLGSASYFCSFTKRILGNTPQAIRMEARRRRQKALREQQEQQKRRERLER